jgi:acetyl esterase
MAALERIQTLAARGLLSLPPGALVRLSGGEPVVADGETLHPEMQVLGAIRERIGGPALSSLTPAQARERTREEARVAAGRPTPVRAVAERTVPGPAGPLPARHYVPDEADGPRPLLVFLHGGGFVVGDLDTHDELCRLLCVHAGAHVLAIDYRLAPEHPFPAAAEDAEAALAWALEHAAELGADPARVAVGGDSAGGNLSAVATQAVVRSGGRPAAQLLIYPGTDMVTPRPALELFDRGAFLTTEDREWYHGNYVTLEQRADPRASPLLAEDLAGLPPALVVTAGFDPLRDEGRAYAEALRAAGSPVVLRHHPGMPHAFANMTGVSPAARDAVIELAGGLRALLGVPPEN